MNRLIYLLFLLCFYSCKKHRESTLHTYLTNDSLSMWDITTRDSIMLNDSLHYYEYTKSISFDISGQSNRYDILVNKKRRIQIIGPKLNYAGLCNKWEILNDSTVKLNCRDVFVIKIISRDTLHLIDTLGVKQHKMYRVQPPWNIDEESIKTRDNQLESGEYLDRRVY